jgi:endonuclease I
MKSWVILVANAFIITACADEPPGYYSMAEGAFGGELREALHQVVRNHKVIPYSSGSFDTSDALKVLDQDPNNTNNVVLIYANTTHTIASFGLTTGWNREHLWPNSYGLDDVHPAYSDLHNLRACDANVNSSRGNKFYDISNTNGPGYNNPAHAEAPLCSTDTDSWEPPSFQKGDIARAMFYMTVRYTGDVAGEPRLTLTDSLNAIGSATNFMGRLSTLLKWHFEDPVSAGEELRNDLVYSLYQTNRNPFVDRPEFVAAMFLPKLEIAAQEAVLSLSWSTNSPVMVLEDSTSLTGTWSGVTNAAMAVSNAWVVTVPVELPERFFRLRLP